MIGPVRHLSDYAQRSASAAARNAVRCMLLLAGILCYSEIATHFP
jgi:hypothetical protein